VPADKVQLDEDGYVQLNQDGYKVLSDNGENCCCTSDCALTCFTKHVSRWNCDTLAWTTPTSLGNFCLDPSTSEAWTSTGTPACVQTKYTAVDRSTCCTTNTDCTTPSTAPSAPTGTPTGCCPKTCGCSSVVADTVTIAIAGTTSCTACFTAADNTGSAKLTGTTDGVYTLAFVGSCRWQASFGLNFGGNSPVLLQDCFDLDCSHLNGPIPADAQDTVDMTVVLHRVAADTWRIEVQATPGATVLYDSGNFTWGDQDACSGVSSGGQANTSTGCVLATGCAPNSAAHGGTATAQF
jgi:hypothetical protein